MWLKSMCYDFLSMSFECRGGKGFFLGQMSCNGNISLIFFFSFNDIENITNITINVVNVNDHKCKFNSSEPLEKVITLHLISSV